MLTLFKGGFIVFPKNPKCVFYQRVSTKAQRFDWQKVVLENFMSNLKKDGHKTPKILKTFKEKTSGHKERLPVRSEALEYCLKNDAILLSATLDRFTRSASGIKEIEKDFVIFLEIANSYSDHRIACVAPKKLYPVPALSKSPDSPLGFAALNIEDMGKGLETIIRPIKGAA